MGMSSSQARLLSLTGRMHDIELKSQRIQAEKLRLANESDKVYTDYLNVLDAKKVQYRSINADGVATFIDATLARLENGAVPGYAGETSDKTFLIKNAGTNEIYVTPEFASAYGISATGDVSDPGSLEDYLTTNGAHKREIMTTVTDYSDIQSVNPVENVKVSEAYDQLVTDPDTYDCHVGNLTAPSTVDHYQTPVYGISGGYTPASGTAGSTSYSVTDNMPTMSVQAHSVTGNTVDVVTTGGTAATAAAPSTVNGPKVVTKTTNSITPQTYNSLQSVTYQFIDADKDLTLQQLSDKYGWNFSFTDTTLTHTNGNTTPANVLRVDYADLSSVNRYLNPLTDGASLTYTSTTKLSDILRFVANNSSGRVTYDYANNKLTTTSTSIVLKSQDDAYNDHVLSYYLCGDTNSGNSANFSFSSSATQFTIDSKVSDVVKSNKRLNNSVWSGSLATGWRYNGYLHVRNSSGDSYTTSMNSASSTLTYRQYLDYLKTVPELAAEGFNYTVKADGTIDMSMNGDFRLEGFDYLTSTLTKDANQTNTTTVKVSLDAIAENIYMMESIINSTKLSDHNANHDSRVTTITNKLNSVYGSNYRQLALLNDTLVAALNSRDLGQINHAYSSVKSNIFDSSSIWNISSSNYTDSTSGPTSSTSSGVTTRLTTTTHYEFALDNTNYSITPSTTAVPDGTSSITKGKIKNAPNDADIKEYFAKKMYDSNSAQTYEDYLAKLNGYSMNSYELASLYNNKSNSSLISALISSTSKSDLSSWFNADWNSTYYDFENRVTTDSFTCTNTSTSNSATSPSRTDIIKYLAYQMHSSYPEKTPAEWETYITNKFGSSGWNYSDKNVASISKNFAANSSDILSKLKSGTQLSAYINSFDDYSLSMSGSNNLSFTTTMVGTDEHYVNMDSASDIATRLASDIYAVNPTINPNDVRSQIMSTFSNQQLASLSSYYGTSNWNTIVNALAHYINTSAVSSYINNYNTYSDFRPSASNDFSIETVHNSHLEHHRGRVNIPKIEGIASNLVVAFRKAGYTVEESEVNSRLYALYDESTAANSQDLANINDATCKYLKDSGNVSYIQNIYNKLFSGSSLSIPTTYSTEDYVFDRSIYGRCQVQYGTEEVGTGIFEWVHDDLYDELVSKWNSLKQLAGNKFVIVTPAQTSSYEFVRNLICETGAFLLEFNSSITEMRESSLAVEPTLKEVSDEKDLKRAEADYEAKMRRINQKDTKYDQELASCDTERNAIKQEMDTLKNVMKNNVDLSFKLFS